MASRPPLPGRGIRTATFTSTKNCAELDQAINEWMTASEKNNSSFEVVDIKFNTTWCNDLVMFNAMVVYRIVT